MVRFFIEKSQISDGRVSITGPDAHHIRNVLRLRMGENLYLSTGDEWEYTCEITGFAGDGVQAVITDIQKSARELNQRITLFQCLPKKDKMEQIIQKSVELGVYEIVPVESIRCVARIDPKKAGAKTERWNAIAAAAAKQSKRMVEPKVAKPVSFDEAIRQMAKRDAAFMPYECAEDIKKTRELFGKIQKDQTVAVLIGPEGGFEESEVQKAVEAGIHPVTLGQRILRTETAGPAVLAILMYLLEEV